MGKFFDALERFEKERLTKTTTQKIRKLDLSVLLKYDRVTGKLDLYNREIIKDFETPQRLLDNKFILPDGKLTPKGLYYCKMHAKNPRVTESEKLSFNTENRKKP